jgi:hypothetical protein
VRDVAMHFPTAIVSGRGTDKVHLVLHISVLRYIWNYFSVVCTLLSFHGFMSKYQKHPHKLIKPWCQITLHEVCVHVVLILGYEL